MTDWKTTREALEEDRRKQRAMSDDQKEDYLKSLFEGLRVVYGSGEAQRIADQTRKEICGK